MGKKCHQKFIIITIITSTGAPIESQSRAAGTCELGGALIGRQRLAEGAQLASDLARKTILNYASNSFAR